MARSVLSSRSLRERLRSDWRPPLRRLRFCFRDHGGEIFGVTATFPVPTNSYHVRTEATPAAKDHPRSAILVVRGRLPSSSSYIRHPIPSLLSGPARKRAHVLFTITFLSALHRRFIERVWRSRGMENLETSDKAMTPP